MSLISKRLIRASLESADTDAVAKDTQETTEVKDGSTVDPRVKALAVSFHETYEALAPTYNYETKEETRNFDPTSPNGQLMIAVCQKLVDDKVVSFPEETSSKPTNETPIEAADDSTAATEEVNAPAENAAAVTENAASAGDTAVIDETSSSSDIGEAPQTDTNDVENVEEVTAAPQESATETDNATTDADSSNNNSTDGDTSAQDQQQQVDGGESTSEQTKVDNVEVPQVADTPPVEQTDVVADAHQELNAVDQMTDLVNKVESASDAHQVVQEFSEIKDAVETIRDTAQVANDTGGFSQESFDAMRSTLRHFTTRMGIPEVRFDAVSAEAFTEGKSFVSLEHLDELVEAMKVGAKDLEDRAIKGLSELTDALSIALPSCNNRLGAVVNAACQMESDGSAPIQIDTALYQMLAVDGKIPEDIVQYFNDYKTFGVYLLGDYVGTSSWRGSDACTFAECLAGDTVDELNQRVITKVDAIGDPRTCLTSQQVNFVLPGGGKLFDTIQCVESDNPAVAKLNFFNCNFAPVEPSGLLNNTETLPEGNEGYTRAPLTREQIKTIADHLGRLHIMLDVKRFAQEKIVLLRNLMAAIESTNQRLENGPDHLREVFGQLQQPVQTYLSTYYSLSVWPVTHYLINLVLTTNAFIVLAQRSLAAEKQETSPEATSGAIDTNVKTKVVEEASSES